MRFLNGWLVVKVAQKMNYGERQVCACRSGDCSI